MNLETLLEAVPFFKATEEGKDSIPYYPSFEQDENEKLNRIKSEFNLHLLDKLKKVACQYIFEEEDLNKINGIYTSFLGKIEKYDGPWQERVKKGLKTALNLNMNAFTIRVLPKLPKKYIKSYEVAKDTGAFYELAEVEKEVINDYLKNKKTNFSKYYHKLKKISKEIINNEAFVDILTLEKISRMLIKNLEK